MDEKGECWFTQRGYTQENGDELEDVPKLTQDQIDELELGFHPWYEIEEDVYHTIADCLDGTVESLFPIKRE